MLKSLLLASSAVVALTGLASAGDLPSKAAPVAAPVVAKKSNPFDGFYVGLHGGYGMSDVKQTSAVETYNDGLWTDGFALRDDTSPALENNGEGSVYGGQIGINQVANSGLLVGLELSGSKSAIDGNSYHNNWSPGGLNSNCCSSVSVDGSFTDSVTALGLGQLKIGFASDSYAIYVMGGIAVANVEAKQHFYGINDSDYFDYKNDWSGWRAGWTVGAGVDYMLTSELSIGASYNYVNLGKVSYNADAVENLNDYDWDGTAYHTSEISAQIVKLNLNYQF